MHSLTLIRHDAIAVVERILKFELPSFSQKLNSMYNRIGMPQNVGPMNI